MRLLSYLKQRDTLLLLGLAALLLPFLLLAFYCHPSGDDFWLTNLVREKGIWQAQWEIRQTWSGRYASMLLGAFNPLVFGSFTAYKVLAFVLLALLALALQYFAGGWLGLRLNARQTTLVSLTGLALYLGFMPVVSQVVYWLSGAMSYQVAHIALLFLFGRLLRNRRQGFAASTLLADGLLVLFIAGSNETAMALLCYLLAGLLLFSWWLKRRIASYLLTLLVLAALGALFVALAPGNAVRSAEYPQQGQLLFSLGYAGAVALNNSFNWLVFGPVLLVTALLIPAGSQIKSWPENWRRIHPLFTWLFFYGALLTCFFVSYYSKGDHAPPRVQGTIYLVFLIGWFGNVFHTAQFLASRGWQPRPWPSYAIVLLWLLIFLWMWQSPRSHLATAWSDLASGRAARYDQEMQARYARLRASDCQVCPIPAVQNIPATIFFEEIPADTTWKNRYFSAYFGKKLMLLERR
ncbi:MAG: DUF6056 family protein [Adhaeribacter sp.]